MTNYSNTRELKEDVLFRASESINSTDFGPQAVKYLNRVYRTLCSGASEFLPEYVDDWWWLRDKSVLTLLPATSVGTVDLTNNSVNITFSSPPAVSVAGYRLRVTGWPEQFEIATHTAGLGAATLDSVYTGPTDAAGLYTLMKVTYPLDADVNAIIGPMFGYRQNPRIIGLAPERMDELFPLPELTTGIPTAFALENTQIVRFSHGGRIDGVSMRVEYRFRPVITDLTDEVSSVPLVPLEWRHILADMALTYLLLDKNDDRSNAIALAARTGLAGMLKENRRRLKKMGAESAGHIYPRQGGRYSQAPSKGPLRTESGLIIG
jgi:hypothetical protein